MAQSRLEKIGTIYTRTTGLIKSGALKWDDRPLWYDIYEAFPPKDEPRFDRPAPNVQLKKIFYEEDKPRALFHKNNKKIGAVNLLNTKHQTLSQKFIEVYKKVEGPYQGGATEKQIYQEAIDLLKKDQEEVKKDEEVSLSSAFKEAEDNKVKINVSEIFKE